ncbi:MAG: hypothetical protein LC777_01025, partial [Actinobacteria bacterium]|nr:hypothetical protein [Actinomycetota bacterium]
MSTNVFTDEMSNELLHHVPGLDYRVLKGTMLVLVVEAYLQSKQAAGKSRLEALRALKRHLARTVFQLLRQQP